MWLIHGAIKFPDSYVLIENPTHSASAKHIFHFSHGSRSSEKSCQPMKPLGVKPTFILLLSHPYSAVFILMLVTSGSQDDCATFSIHVSGRLKGKGKWQTIFASSVSLSFYELFRKPYPATSTPASLTRSMSPGHL